MNCASIDWLSLGMNHYRLQFEENLKIDEQWTYVVWQQANIIVFHLKFAMQFGDL